MYDEMIDNFLEELDKNSVEEILFLAGTDILSDEVIDPNEVRAGSEAYTKKAQIKSAEIILGLLPKIQEVLESNPKLFSKLSKESLLLFLEETKKLFSSSLLKKKTQILLSMSILKKGIQAFVPIEGISPFEAELSYLTFDLKISEDKILSLSDDGEVSDDLKFNEKILKKYLMLIENDDIESAKEYGTFLWDILFPAKINSHFERCMGIVQANDLFKGIRVRLSIENKILIKVPWELARYPQSGDYLAVSSNIILSRYIHRTGRLGLARDFKPFTNLGILIAEPDDLNKINAEDELKELKEIKNNPMNIIEIVPGTSENLRKTIEKNSIDILHYIGHGDFSEDKGYLLLETSSKGYDMYSSDRAANISNLTENKIKIIVLNSCKGAMSTSHTHFSGVAIRLIQKNVPAVIAMQYNITNQSAIIFSTVFYQAIIDGFPIEYSMQKARQAIFNDIGDTKKDFFTPCLFLDY